MSTGRETLAAARAYVAAGLSVIPIARGGRKLPAGRLLPEEWDEAEAKYKSTWNPFKGYEKVGVWVPGRLAMDEELRTWFDRKDPPGIGVICGAVSGNLETIDFDRRADEIFPAWSELVEAETPGLLDKLCVVRTPREPAGYHVRYCCPEVCIPGNTKLAEEPVPNPETGKDERGCLIETRGEGGYALAPGSPPECHENNRPYTHHSGPKVSQVETITAAERDTLLRCAGAFDAKPVEEEQVRGGAFKGVAVKTVTMGISPGDDFNVRGWDWPEIITGWKEVYKKGKERRWRRPGKETGWSATTGVCFSKKNGWELLKVFSTNADPFEPGPGYSKFAAYALVQHGGDFKAAAQKLYDLGFGTRREEQSGQKAKGAAPRYEPDTGEGLITTPLSTIRPEPVRWEVDGLIPTGKIALVAGDGGHGKTTLTLELAAGVSRGRAVFGMAYEPRPPGEVLIISCEDDFGDTIVPRLLALGADLDKVHRVDGVKTRDGKAAPFSLAHYESLKRELERRPAVRLVVIDPAGAYIGRAGCDDHKDSELRALLGPLAVLAAERRVAIILVKHLNKGATVKAVNKVSGSTGYVNTVRAAFILAPDPKEPERKLFLPLKFNIGPKPRGFAFRLKALEQAEAEVLLSPFGHLAEEDRQRLAAQLFRPAWEGRVDDDADAVVGEGAKKERGPSKVQQCAEWLEGFLGGYAWPSDEVTAAGMKAGFTFDNVKEAKAQLKAEKGLRHSNRGRFQGVWWCGFGEPESWTFRPAPGANGCAPPHTPLTPESPHSPHNGHGDSFDDLDQFGFAYCPPAAPSQGKEGREGSVGSQGESGAQWPEKPLGGVAWAD
jgi:hypothetical protein